MYQHPAYQINTSRKEILCAPDASNFLDALYKDNCFIIEIFDKCSFIGVLQMRMFKSFKVSGY